MLVIKLLNLVRECKKKKKRKISKKIKLAISVKNVNDRSLRFILSQIFDNFI